MEHIQEITKFSVVNKEGYDLIVYQCGMEKCKPSHFYGPALRDHFLIHFILEGCGSFYVDGKCYNLKKHEGFLICPEVLTYYEADEHNPWVYTWVGFRGIKAEQYLKLANINIDNPIFRVNDGNAMEWYFEEMRKSAVLRFGADLRLQGLLSIFLSELIEKAGKEITEGNNYKDSYIKKTLQFIEMNYSRNISVKDIAQFIGLNKNYFSTLFKQSLGVTPQEYIIKFRINKACELLKNPTLSISDVSRSVGYSDPLGFSKIFKQVKGSSPKAFRNIPINTTSE
jgi:AraC-like DNA-binding protein